MELCENKEKSQENDNEQQEMDLITEKMQKGEYRVFSDLEELINHLEVRN